MPMPWAGLEERQIHVVRVHHNGWVSFIVAVNGMGKVLYVDEILKTEIKDADIFRRSVRPAQSALYELWVAITQMGFKWRAIHDPFLKQVALAIIRGRITGEIEQSRQSPDVAA